MAPWSCSMLNYFLFPLSITEAQVLACVNPFSLLFYGFLIYSQLCLAMQKSIACIEWGTVGFAEVHRAEMLRLNPGSNFGSEAPSRSDE